MFKWGVSRQLLPASTYHALASVEGLRKGRSAAREPQPILPVDDATVDATLPHLSQVVADMVRFQRLTGCRPGEVCQLRPMDLDRTGEVWSYRPGSHKTEHHGRERVIFVGPKAKALLVKYIMGRDPAACCFSPAESEQKRLELRHAARKTPLRYGNRPGTNRKRRPIRAPSDHYTKDSYYRAIRRATDKAGLPPWAPNRLRHTRATQVRKQFGLEAAQVVLGHSKADVTQVYAERDMGLAASIMAKIG